MDDSETCAAACASTCTCISHLPAATRCMARGHGQMRHPGKCVVTAASSIVPRSVAVLCLAAALSLRRTAAAGNAVSCPLVARCQINADYAATAVLISFGAVLGKAPPRARSFAQPSMRAVRFRMCARAVRLLAPGGSVRLSACVHRESRPTAIS